jgi:O-antigen/teichoic acid export membrane protein
MATEAVRGLIRIASNYLRLGFSLSMGLIIVPLQLAYFGTESFGLINLVVGAVGLTALVEEGLRTSTVRELGAAYHTGDEQRFIAAYNSALKLSLRIALVSALIFLTFWPLLVFVFNIKPELLRAAQLMLLSEGIHWLIFSLISPANNMYAIRERFFEDNLWMMLRKANYLIAIGVVAIYPGMGDPIRAFEWYVVVAPLLSLVVLSISTSRIVLEDRRLVPKLSSATHERERALWAQYAHNLSVTAAYSLYEVGPRFIINIFFGLIGNTIATLAFQIVSYMRQASSGMNAGLDAVSARVSSGRSTMSLAELTRHSTRLHAFSVMPCVFILLTMTEPLLSLWIRKRIENPEQHLSTIVVMSKIFLLQVVVRSISDAWVRIMYGAGYSHRFARIMLVGGILSPVLTIAGLLAFREQAWGIYIPAIVLTTVYSVFQFGVLPRVMARVLGIRTLHVLTPIIRPTIAAAVASPVLFLARFWIEAWTIWHVLAVFVAYGALFASASWWIVLSPDERRRFGNSIFRRARTLAGVGGPPSKTTPAPAPEVSAAQRELRLEADEIINP